MGKQMVATPPGKLLREWRLGAGKTQTDCASAVSVTQSAWADWEAGARYPREDTALKIEGLTAGEVPASAWGTRRRRVAA